MTRISGFIAGVLFGIGLLLSGNLGHSGWTEPTRRILSAAPIRFKPLLWTSRILLFANGIEVTENPVGGPLRTGMRTVSVRRSAS